MAKAMKKVSQSFKIKQPTRSRFEPVLFTVSMPMEAFKEKLSPADFMKTVKTSLRKHDFGRADHAAHFYYGVTSTLNEVGRQNHCYDLGLVNTRADLLWGSTSYMSQWMERGHYEDLPASIKEKLSHRRGQMVQFLYKKGQDEKWWRSGVIEEISETFFVARTTDGVKRFSYSKVVDLVLPINDPRALHEPFAMVKLNFSFSRTAYDKVQVDFTMESA